MAVPPKYVSCFHMMFSSTKFNLIISLDMLVRVISSWYSAPSVRLAQVLATVSPLEFLGTAGGILPSIYSCGHKYRDTLHDFIYAMVVHNIAFKSHSKHGIY